jgi:hypothetical protein
MRAFEALGDKKKLLSGICFSFGAKKLNGFEELGRWGRTFQPRITTIQIQWITWRGLVMCQFLSDEKF